MKRFSHFLSEARDAEDAIYGRRGAEKRRREQKERVMKKARNRLNQVTAHDAPPSAPAPQTDDSNLIHVGGNYMGRPDYSESLDPLVDVMNRLYPVPDWKLMEDTQSSYYIFRTDNQQVLARGVVGFDNVKQRASYIRKRHGPKFDQVRFKKERKAAASSNYGRSGGTYRGGRVETSRNYNPSKRGRFRGVSYSDGSYADLD